MPARKRLFKFKNKQKDAEETIRDIAMGATVQNRQKAGFALDRTDRGI